MEWTTVLGILPLGARPRSGSAHGCWVPLVWPRSPAEGRLRQGLISVVVVYLIVAAVGVATAATVHPRHELWFGLGGGTSSEQNVFNVPDDLESHPELLLSLGYLRNLDARHAVGLHLYGGTETWPPFSVQGPSGAQAASFELDSYNFGARYRFTFSRGKVEPYTFVGFSAATGVIESSATGSLHYNGWSACAGPGISVRLGRNFKLSAEGVASFGGANWESDPLPNSSSRSFDPSLLGGTANLSLVWGGPPASKPAAVAPAVKDSSLASSTRSAPRNVLGSSPALIVLNEACIVLLSSAAYADDQGGTLAGVTLAAALLGTAAGGSDLENPKSVWIMFGGLVALAGGVLAMGHSGASNDALFVTSIVSWNVIAFAVNRAERNASTRR